jgi:hypothetical protein
MVSKSKVVWRVAEAPTGMYRSFEHRAWPSGTYTGTDEPAVHLMCADDYVPRHIKTGQHAELTVRVADHSAKPRWQWRTLKRRCKTLQEAKELVETFLAQSPHYAPLVTEQNVTSVTLTIPTDAL